MSVQLSSLRVTVEGDSSSYVTAMNAVDAANKQMAASGTLAGAQLAQQDVAAGNTSAALTRLSKANVDGYGSAYQFSKGVASLQSQMESGRVTADRAATTYTGLVNHFGMVADATKIATGGNKDFSAIVDSVNQKVALQTGALDKAKAGTAQYSDQLRIIQGQLVAAAGGLGMTGVLLASMGPWGLAAAVGLGAASAALSTMSEMAHGLAQHARELNTFAEVTGLTTDQIQALEERAAKFGLTSEQTQTAVARFTAGFNELRLGTGTLLTQINRIDPALTDQMAAATDAASAMTLYGQALQKTSDIFQRNALMKAGTGRSLQAAPVFAGLNVAQLTQDFVDSGKAIDQNLIGSLAKAQTQIDLAKKHSQDMMASLWAAEYLGREREALDLMDRMATRMQQMRDTASGSWWTNFWVQVGQAGGGQQMVGVGAQPGEAGYGTVDPVARAKARLAAGLGAGVNSDQQLTQSWQPAEMTPQFVANRLKDQIAAMGEAAPAALRLDLAQKQLAISGKAAGLSETQMAVAARQLNENYASTALNARISALGMMANTTEIATQAQYKINKANLEGANIDKTQAALIKEADQLKFAATKQNTDASFGLAAETDILNQKTAEFLNTANQLNYSESQRAAGLLVVARNAKAAYESSQIAASAHPQLTQLGFDAVNLDKQFDQFAVGGINSMTTALADISMGTKSAGDAFRNLGLVVIRSLEEMIIKMMIMKSLAPLLGGGGGFNILSLFGLGGGNGAGAVQAGNNAVGSSGIGFASGGVMTSRGALQLNRYAGGGVADSPQLAMFGEGRTPEAYVPLPDGRSIPVNINVPKGAGSGGPVTNISPVYNIDARGSNMTEAQFQAILAKNNAQLAKDINNSLPDRVAAINRDPRRR